MSVPLPYRGTIQTVLVQVPNTVFGTSTNVASIRTCTFASMLTDTFDDAIRWLGGSTAIYAIASNSLSSKPTYSLLIIIVHGRGWDLSTFLEC